MEATMSNITEGSNKRQRWSLPNPWDKLPRETLEAVGGFLPKLHRALFALSMTDGSGGDQRPSASSPTMLRYLSPSGSFVQGEWEVLDFNEIEECLASKLTDDDVCGLLMAIDAVNNVKRLKLAGCVNITGKGLEPLRNSVVLEQIDLSLVGPNNSPDLKPKPPISQDAVVPILVSIVENDDCNLKHIQLPKKWTGNPNESLKGFFRLYDQLLRGRHNNCLSCERPLPERRRLANPKLQPHTCAKCLNTFCWLPPCPIKPLECEVCEKMFCGSCVQSERCAKCSAEVCRECRIIPRNNDCYCTSGICQYCIATCKYCNTSGCDDCVLRCHNENCGKANCETCFDGKEYDVERCETCWNDGISPDADFCLDCRFMECSDHWGEACVVCVGIVGQAEIPELSKENAKLLDEMEQRDAEVAKLKEENSKLRKENEALKK